MLGSPELDSTLQLLSQESRAVQESHLPQPPGHTAFDAAQDTTDLLACKHTLLAHVQLFSYQNCQVILGRAALSDFSQSALTPAIAMTQVWHLAVWLVELHKVLMGPLFKFFWVPLDDIPSFCVNCTAQLHVISKIYWGCVWLLMLKSIGFQTEPWGAPLLTSLPVNTEPQLSESIQPITYPPCEAEVLERPQLGLPPPPYCNQNQKMIRLWHKPHSLYPWALATGECVSDHSSGNFLAVSNHTRV